MKSIFVSFGLQRSGQHLMIEWICRGLLPDTLHLNHCVFFRDGLSFKLTPFNGRRVIYCNETIDDSGAQGQSDFNKSLPYPSPQHLFFSLEDRSPEENDEKAFIKSHNPFLVFFLRDPANWLASGLRHGLHDPESLRDNKDKYRSNSPLVVAKDAIRINNNGTFDKTISQINNHIKKII